MRGDADTASHGPPELTRPARRALAGTVIVLAVVTASGGTTSPLLPALSALLILVIRHAPSPHALAAPAAAAAALLMTAALSGDADSRDVAAAFLLALSAAPGWLWRRESRRSTQQLTRLDDILSQAERNDSGEVPAAADELADLERALGSIAARVQARAVVLWDVDGYNGTARARAGSSGRPANALRLSGDPLGWVWEQGMRLRLDPPPRWSPSGLVVVADRLRREEERGQLVTYSFDPPDLPADDERFEEVAVYLRGMLQLQEARAGAAASRRRTDALTDGLNRIPGELALAPLTTELCMTAMAITDATGAAIATWTVDQGEVLAVAGTDGGPRAGDLFAPPSSELALAVRADTILVRSADDWNIGRTCVANPDEKWIVRPRAMAAMPLRGTEGVIGVIAVWTSRARSFDPDGLELLFALAPYAALHIEHARQYGTLKETADRDPLTLLKNRRAFDEVLDTETTRFARYSRPLSLLMLDIDHFKAVNDTHGHEAGDEVLRQVARSITACIRDVDTAARLGGEEFVVLMPETDIPPALEVAERIRSVIGETSIPWRGSTLSVHVSIGVSSCPAAAAHPRELIGTADAALYKAKEAGRNRVVRADIGAGKA
ncbi:MAG: GGDEF domain-containing protein [Gemmatimonadota bacterium]